MNLLELANPTGWWWLLLAIPIGLLYVLKIRLRRQSVSTLLFWDKLYDEKKPRSWWQRLRHLLSLLLQLAFLILLVSALVDPLWSWQKDRQRRIVLILDNSASMNAVEADGFTRLQLAKESSDAVVRSLREGDRMAILSAGGTSRVAIGMTNHQRSLHDAIGSLPPTEGPTDVPAAVAIAERLLVGEEKEAEIIVITDGCFDGAETLQENPKISLYGIGSSLDNVGITRYQARRSLLDAIEYQVLIDVTNYSQDRRSCRVELNLEDELVDVIPLELEAGETQTRVVDHSSANGGRLIATLDIDDAFDTDNNAIAVLPKRDPIPVVLVSNGNLFLKSVLESIPLVDLRIVSESPKSVPRNGILVLDRISPQVIPNGRVMVVQPESSCDLWKVGETIAEPIVATVNSDSPLTKHLRLDNVLFPDARVLEIGDEYESLIRDPLDQVLLARIRRNGGDIVVLNCSLERGDLPLRIAFPVLMKNAVEWFQGNSGELQPAVRTGQMISVDISSSLPDMDSSDSTFAKGESRDELANVVIVESKTETESPDFVLISPDDESIPIAVIDERATIGPLLKTGVWRIQPAAFTGESDSSQTSAPENTSAIACNLAHSSESDLRPRTELTEVQALGMLSLGGRSLWFYLTMVATVLITTEWWLYQRRIVG